MKDESFKDFILDQLDGVGEIRAAHMFGGFGFYFEEVFFGIVYNGRLYFKTDEADREEYLKEGMEAFRPNPEQTLKNYYEVPAEVIEDEAQLVVWALKAIALRGA